MIKVGINGYGRIARCFHRQILNDNEIELVAINKRNELQPILFEYDSVYGRIDADVKFENGVYSVNGKKIELYSSSKPEEIPWSDLDIIIDSTGKFKKYSELEKHIGKADKVILTCPPKDDSIKQFVIGVNENEYTGEKIISNASCTTNAMAPILKAIGREYKIKEAYFTTIHAITSSQPTLDNYNKDIRRARAAYESMIPTTTGAAKSIEAVMPELKGKVHAQAMRVPVSTVSAIDATVITDTPVENIINLFERFSPNIIGVSKKPLVSVDFKGDSRSSVIDAEYTKSFGNVSRILAWYDNEYGYTARLVDLIKHVEK